MVISCHSGGIRFVLIYIGHTLVYLLYGMLFYKIKYTHSYNLCSFVDYDLSFDGDLNMITLDLVLRQLRYIPAPGKFLTVGQRKEVDILKRYVICCYVLV